MSVPTRVSTLAAAALGAAVLLSACGGAAGSYAGGTSASPATAPSAGAPGAASTATATTGSTPATAKTVTASEKEFSIALSSSSLSPGTYTFRATNNGSITHALTISGPGVADKTTGDISPGSSASVTVTLQPGSYDVFCPVGNHKMLGMDETVTVS